MKIVRGWAAVVMSVAVVGALGGVPTDRAAAAPAPGDRRTGETDAGAESEAWTDRASAPNDPQAVEDVPTVAQARPGEKVVYLTFDDGPDAQYTPQMLALLRAYRAKATFFMTGRQARANPALVGRVRAEGHAIGNHSDTHPRLSELSADDVRAEIRNADTALGGTRCMRPPFGAYNDVVSTVVKEENKTLQLWDVETNDWATPGVFSIVNAVRSKVANGSVVLMHDSGGRRDQSVAALAILLPDLTLRGYRMEALPACR